MDIMTVPGVLLQLLVWVTVTYADVSVRDVTNNKTVATYSDMQASFGLDFPTYGLQGWLVYAHPDPKACGAIDEPPSDKWLCNGTSCNFILLVARGGNCEFSDKVLNAQRAGYVAAIVHNFPGKNYSGVEMLSCTNGSLVKIPSTFVGYSDGMKLLQYNWTSGRYILKIWEEDDLNFPKYLWPFLLAMAICILVALAVLLVKVARDHTNKTRSRLSKKHLKKIPVKKFKKGDYYDTCAICLDEYEEGEKIRVLPCDHVYHMKCIDPWLTKNKKTCPVCKRRVIPGRDADSESESGEEEQQQNSERQPLLGGGASPAPSHGSMGVPDTLLNIATSSTVVQPGTSDASSSSQVSDLGPGAVGGVGLSDQQDLALPKSDNLVGETPVSERKRRRRNEALVMNEGDEASSLLGSEARSEQRERRKLRKDKKKKENRHRLAESSGQRGNDERQAENTRVAQNEDMNQREVVNEDLNQEEVLSEADVRGGQGNQLTAAGADSAQGSGGDGGGLVNPGFSDNSDVILSGAPASRREMSDIV